MLCKYSVIENEIKTANIEVFYLFFGGYSKFDMGWGEGRSCKGRYPSLQDQKKKGEGELQT